MKTEIIHIGKMLTELVTQAQHIDSELTDYLLQAKNRVNYLRGGKTVVLLKPESNRQKAQYSKVR